MHKHKACFRKTVFAETIDTALHEKENYTSFNYMYLFLQSFKYKSIQHSLDLKMVSLLLKLGADPHLGVLDLILFHLDLLKEDEDPASRQDMIGLCGNKGLATTVLLEQSRQLMEQFICCGLDVNASLGRSSKDDLLF